MIVIAGLVCETTLDQPSCDYYSWLLLCALFSDNNSYIEYCIDNNSYIEYCIDNNSYIYRVLYREPT